METFVVRIWIPADSEAGQAPDVLRGFVEHARSGGGASFSSGEALLASLAVLLGARLGEGGPATRNTSDGAATAPQLLPIRRL